MTIEEINNKAKVLRFPPAPSYPVPEGVNVVDLPDIKGSRYSGFNLNSNHFTPEYHKESVIPMLENILNFKVDGSFEWTIHKVDGQNAEIGYYKPKDCNKYRFSVRKVPGDEEISGNFEILMALDDAKAGPTEYHRMYRYPHQCSIVKNIWNNTGRRLLIFGDSQLIPEIPLFCCFFDEVWYFDKRNGGFNSAEIFKNENFTDVLFEMGGQTYGMIQTYLSR